MKMNDLLFAWDTTKIDSSKIEEGTDSIHGPTTTFKDVVIASQIIHPYEDGKAYKPADELNKAYWTWEGRWAKANSHPETGIIANRDNIQGKTVNLRFVKNLKDHKTGRPNRRGILADLVVFNKKVSSETLEAMKNGEKTDVSIGFWFSMDATPGTIDEDGHPLNGMSYDYIQRNLMGDHIAFALEDGRCPMPLCGIGADQLLVMGDPFAGFKNFADCVKQMMKPKSKGGQGYTKKQAEGTCGKLKKEHEDSIGDMSVKAEDMTIEGIESKISELKEQRKALRNKISDLYKERTKDPVDEKIDELYDQMSDINDEIRAYKEAKVLKITINATGDTEWWQMLDWKERKDAFEKLPDDIKQVITDAGLCPECGEDDTKQDDDPIETITPDPVENNPPTAEELIKKSRKLLQNN